MTMVEERVERLDAEALLTPEKEGQALVVWRRFRRHRLAIAGMIVVGVFIMMAIFANYIAPYDPITYQDPYYKNAPPTALHVLGTDEIGRDVFSRLLYAARVSLTVSFFVTMTSVFIGAVIGGVSGYFGGWVDNAIQRVVDFCLPYRYCRCCWPSRPFCAVSKSPWSLFSGLV